jgi:POT family proton-dependent oligopeptide transporter
MISPLICGYIGQKINYRYGFAAAGAGMILGLLQYRLGRGTLGTAGLRPPLAPAGPSAQTAASWSNDEKRRLAAMGVLVLASAVFWSLYEQAGSTLNLFAEEKSRNEILGWAFPSSWLQAVPALMVIAMAPMFAWLWVRLGKRDPSPVVKFTLGLVFAGLGFLLLVPAAQLAGTTGRVSPLWLIGTYFLHTVGELCLSPVGLSATTKLAPARAGGLLMGIWFLSMSIGNFMGGQMAALYGALDLGRLFLNIALFGIGAGIVLVCFVRPMDRLMGGAR